MTALSLCRRLRIAFVAGAIAAGALGTAAAKAETTVTVGVVNDFSGWDPYADSTAQMYMIWCQTYGCLGAYDTTTGEYTGLLAESWDVDPKDNNVWYFHLRKGLKRHHDGRELTADDVVHSIDRTKHDPHTAQINNIRPVKTAVALDRYTVKIVTVQPTAPLLAYLFDHLIITPKDLYEKYGDDAYRKAPWGWGPYQIEDIQVGQRFVLHKNPNWPGIKKANPDRIIFRRIKEEEARVTALLNGEIQIAEFIPPHLLARVEKAPGVHVLGVPSVEDMFLTMNPKFKPWDNMKLRQAVAYAIDREAIIKSIFQGRASLLDGPVGPGQYGYSPEVTPKYRYDPAKAKKLLAEAGYPNGIDVDFYTATNRYINDRQTAEAMAAMLTKVGIRARLHTPEYSTHWPKVRKGKVSFYYQGHGSTIDPSATVHQFWVVPPLSKPDPEMKQLLDAERSAFDPAQRKKLLLELFDHIQEEVPAFFLWRIDMLYGISNKLAFQPRSNDRVYGTDITVKP